MLALVGIKIYMLVPMAAILGSISGTGACLIKPRGRAKRFRTKIQNRSV